MADRLVGWGKASPKGEVPFVAASERGFAGAVFELEAHFKWARSKTRSEGRGKPATSDPETKPAPDS